MMPLGLALSRLARRPALARLLRYARQRNDDHLRKRRANIETPWIAGVEEDKRMLFRGMPPLR